MADLGKAFLRIDRGCVSGVDFDGELRVGRGDGGAEYNKDKFAEGEGEGGGDYINGAGEESRTSGDRQVKVIHIDVSKIADADGKPINMW